MWWHNDDETRKFCSEILEERLKHEQIESADDFDVILGEPSITIWDRVLDL